MADYVLRNAIRLAQAGKGPATLRAGAIVSDTEYDIAALRAAGALLTPKGGTELAAQTAFADAERLRGNSSPEAASLQPLGASIMRSGSLTIAAGTTETAVVLSPAEKDASYRLLFSVSGYTGTPAAGSTRPRVKAATKATGGFTVEVEADPGVGASVSVDWFLVRD